MIWGWGRTLLLAFIAVGVCTTAALGGPLRVPQLHVDPAALAIHIETQTLQVPEFARIAELAQDSGFRVWIFGGTAASFAHHVKLKMLSHQLDPEFARSHLGNRLEDFIRSSQDIDIVIDGTREEAVDFEQRLQAEYPYFRPNGKTQWEVRPLRESRDGREAIFGNPDFVNQHSDSHSTGLIELRSQNTVSADAQIIDARFFSDTRANTRNLFLEDVAAGRITYHFSELHHTTRRFQQKLNPPIISALRYLIKVSQFGLTMDPSDLARIHSIIQNFTPERTPVSKLVKSWIKKNAAKIFLNARDVEWSWEIVNRLGLRQKIEHFGNSIQEESFNWWVAREPLRSFAVGQGQGRTIRELFATIAPEEPYIVVHRAREYPVVEVLARNPFGRPNALGNSGHGTSLLRELILDRSSLDVEYDVDPMAREGTDYRLEWVQDKPRIIFINRSAIHVRYSVGGVHPTDSSFEEIFEALESQPSEHLKRSLIRQMASRDRECRLEPMIFEYLKSFPQDVALFMETYARGKKNPLAESPRIFEIAVGLAMNAAQKASLILAVGATQSPAIVTWIRDRMRENQSWSETVFLEAIAEYAKRVGPNGLGLWIVEQLLTRGERAERILVDRVLFQASWAAHPAYLLQVIQNSANRSNATGRANLKQILEHWQVRWFGRVNLELVAPYLEYARRYPVFGFYLTDLFFLHPDWQNHPQVLEPFFEDPRLQAILVRNLAHMPGWRMPWIFDRITGDPVVVRAFYERVHLYQESWTSPEQRAAIARFEARMDEATVQEQLKRPHIQERLLRSCNKLLTEAHFKT